MTSLEFINLSPLGPRKETINFLDARDAREFVEDERLSRHVKVAGGRAGLFRFAAAIAKEIERGNSKPVYAYTGTGCEL
jgi:hypothetical protein